MNMKALFSVLALGVLSNTIHGQKLFHEHYDDFIQVLEDDADELIRIAEQYLEFDEFISTVLYLQSKDFKEIIYEMESLPEFNAVSN